MLNKKGVTAIVTPTDVRAAKQSNASHCFNFIIGSQALARAIAYLINPAFDIAELKGAYRRRDEGRAGRGDLILIRKWERLIALAMLPHSQIIITNLSRIQESL